MAIDTRQKRESSFLDDYGALLAPDGTIGTADRIQLLGWYAGILFRPARLTEEERAALYRANAVDRRAATLERDEQRAGDADSLTALLASWGAWSEPDLGPTASELAQQAAQVARSVALAGDGEALAALQSAWAPWMDVNLPVRASDLARIAAEQARAAALAGDTAALAALLADWEPWLNTNLAGRYSQSEEPGGGVASVVVYNASNLDPEDRW